MYARAMDSESRRKLENQTNHIQEMEMMRLRSELDTIKAQQAQSASHQNQINNIELTEVLVAGTDSETLCRQFKEQILNSFKF